MTYRGYTSTDFPQNYSKIVVLLIFRSVILYKLCVKTWILGRSVIKKSEIKLVCVFKRSHIES
jgi:hypothetical protein